MGLDVGETQATTRRLPGGPAKGDRRRQAIVDAIEELLRERTIAELSVENLAAAAGISRSGFYFYFESKYAALGDALSDVGDAMARAAEDFFTGTEELPETYVRRELTAVWELWRRHADLMVAVIDAAHSDAGARALWEAWVERFVSAICDRIDAEREAGRTARAATPPRQLARMLMLMNSAVFDDMARHRLGEAAAAERLDALTHVWLSTVWGVTDPVNDSRS